VRFEAYIIYTLTRKISDCSDKIRRNGSCSLDFCLRGRIVWIHVTIIIYVCMHKCK